MEIDAKSLREKFAAQEMSLRSKEFISPFTEKSKVVHVKIDKIIHPFKITGHKGHGFGIFKPTGGVYASYVKEAPFEVCRSFLDALPLLHFILSYQTDQGWVCYPMNIESARKSLGLDGQAIVCNVSDCERFDAVVTRFDGIHFWYDSIFAGGNPQKSVSMRESFHEDWSDQKMIEQISSIPFITPEDKIAFEMALASWAMYKKMSTEDRIRQSIDSGGGKFVNYVLRGANVEIKWLSKSGAAYNSLVNKDTLDVISAGICLAGEDKKFHLKDLPFIVEDGEDRGLIHLTRWEQEYSRNHRRRINIVEDY